VAIKRVEDLEAFQYADRIMLMTYEVVSRYPDYEKFGLISQMRRASMSIPANIVEGFRRRYRKEKIRFYNYSQSSADELKYYYKSSVKLGYLKECKEALKLLDSTSRMLTSLIRKTPKMRSCY